MPVRNSKYERVEARGAHDITDAVTALSRLVISLSHAVARIHNASVASDLPRDVSARARLQVKAHGHSMLLPDG